jgi:hypothetical protein
MSPTKKLSTKGSVSTALQERLEGKKEAPPQAVRQAPAKEIEREVPRAREEALKFLESLTQFLGTYHNHKENSAWASVGLFVIVAGQILSQKAVSKPLSNDIRLALSTTVTLFMTVTLFFMWKQFSLRRLTTRRIASCFRVRCELISGERQLNQGDFLVPPKEFLPQIVSDDVRQLGPIGTKSVWSLEIAAYTLVLITGVGVAIRVWQ